MKILIAVPTFENILPDTFKSIYNLDPAGHELSFDFVRGYDCAKARNAIAQNALDGNFDYVLMVDSDIVLPDQAIQWFAEKPDDIVFGVYPHRNSKDGEVELFKLRIRDFKDRFKYSELKEDRMEVKGGGFGCAFVSADVFRKMEYPWFKYVAYSNGTFLSEDLYFCSEARKHGFKIYADTRMRCGHFTRYIQWE